MMRAGEVLSRPRVAAIMTAFNEGDVIGASIAALVEEDIDVYLIDNCSTDDTVERAQEGLGRGVLKIERFPDDAGFPERAREKYVWKALLERVEQVALELDHDWFLFVNPDEFRESPWPDLGLTDALGYVDSLGYSAVNFELYDFQPVDDEFVPGSDPREHILMYESGGTYNQLQIKGWKAHPEARLAWSGGHDTRFPGRRIFPIPFIMRHYGLRGETHGRRKVFEERMPRYAEEERAGGWHVQYDEYLSGAKTFLRDPATLTLYDGDAVRAQLLARASRDMALAEATRGFDPVEAPIDTAALAGWGLRATAGTCGPAGSELTMAVNTLAQARAAVQLPATPSRAWMAAARVVALENRMRGAFDRVGVYEQLAATLAEQAEATASAVEGTRAFVTLVSADEAIERPELLAAYGSVFGASDDATLVIYGTDPDADTLAARLAPALAAAGLDGDDSPDMLAITVPSGHEASLAGRASAVLGSAVADLPSFEADAIAGLKGLAATAAGGPDELQVTSDSAVQEMRPGPIN